MRDLLQRAIRGLPPFPGKLRLARLLLGDLHGPAVIKDRFGFLYEVPDLREPIAFHLLINESYEPQTQEFLHRMLRPSGTLIDVGANINVFSVLQKNVALNNIGNVRLICAAAGSTNDEAMFYPAPVDHFGMGSRAPQFNATPITVHLITLDSLVSKLNLASIDLIKIDVEGFELDVLKGASGLLSAKKPPLVIFEFCDWAETRSGGDLGGAQRFLLDRGFQIWRAPEYDCGSPISAPLTTGGDMLVARR